MPVGDITTGVPATVRVLDRDQAATVLNISVRMLDALDADGQGPRPVRIGRRRLYRLADLETWLADRAAAGV